MAARSFEEAVAAARGEPDDEQDELDRLADAEEEAFMAKVINGLDEHLDKPEPPPPSPMQDVQQMMAMMASQNNQLMQANQQLQQQVMTLTQQLTTLSAQMAAGGASGIAPAPRQIKRAEQMTEEEQWKNMHGEHGLIG